ncbi:MAG: hypothetical protein ACR2PY_06850 [Salinispira sp.]
MSRNVDEQSIPNTGFQTLDESLWKSVLNVEEQRNPAKALEKMGLLVADEGGSQRGRRRRGRICRNTVKNPCLRPL